MVDSWHSEGDVDLVDRYAALIPARAVSELLGLPKDDIPHFTKLVYSVSRIISFTFTQDDLPEMEAAARELQSYVESLISGRRGRLAMIFS